ncbi:MAG: protein-L-isoaspartate(D-aspartate) O-methyltransferase [Pseudoxanthomonas sp.]|nr:protein-L-isoaspartate(D-aspartate) O-methyltransferase [Pseudoxanthomonas sp.]
MPDYARARDRMVQEHLAARGIRDPRVLDAMRAVPRERFVEPGMDELAYDDSPLPIGEGQTISQPYIVALMAQAADIEPDDHVLEVGAGSGYAAAVLGRLATQVDTVERHPALAAQAASRLHDLGQDNVHVHVGDGSRGWPVAAPFDAILVAAGAPEPPPALREQLAIGGRLVVPVDDGHGAQRLRRILRVDEMRYEDDDLGGVIFVPLVGAQGWTEDGHRVAAPHPGAGRKARNGTNGADEIAQVAAAAEHLPGPDAAGFADAFERFADCRVVLLGECSHGTSEFYRARAAITRMLVERHGFDIVAAEADWPDAAAINRHVRHRSVDGRGAAFQRFPTWMWRNTDVTGLVAWMRRHNEGRAADVQVGFYGLDLYSLGASIAAVLEYLDRVDPEAAAVARRRYACLTPWQNAPASYGRAALGAGYATCEKAVVRQCRELLERRLEYAAVADGERYLDATQNARLVASAERYYRAMYYGSAESWNLRDMHMFDTLRHLLEAKGPHSRAIVWAHNSHIGDARHTEMGSARGELNIGQLCREAHGERVALVGFGTHEGTVAAASEWDGDMEIKQVRPSLAGSVERLCHDAGAERCLLDLRRGQHEGLRATLAPARLERFIGVIYLPETELQSHYAQASLSGQFDAYVWFDRTRAVTPLGPEHVTGVHAATGVEETWPSGL